MERLVNSKDVGNILRALMTDVASNGERVNPDDVWNVGVYPDRVVMTGKDGVKEWVFENNLGFSALTSVLSLAFGEHLSVSQ